MALAITFPEKEVWDPGRQCMAFAALRVGEMNKCRITREALIDHCGAGPSLPFEEAFRMHRVTIEGIAARLIRAGRYEPNGEILIRSEDFRR